MKNLNKEIKGIEGRTMKGMIEAILPIRHDMEHTPPLIPVDTGNLRSSFFTVTSEGSVSHGMSPSFKGKDSTKLTSNHATIKTTVAGRAKAAARKGPVVALGFSANYALAIHEGCGRHFRRPGAGAGFFIQAIKRNKGNVLDAIRRNARVK
jgi:hypothetical protein